ncbi:MAG: nucleotidyltransferase domain-containing protein [Deltaproteobacteria bacterium]|nr:nucleotidyltransferase domain-containing protein [Deltaproteobacteria bacterium]
MAVSNQIRAEIEKIVRKIVEGYGPERIILFGSYAYGVPHQDSDVDLLIIKQTSQPFIDRLVQVRKILTDPNRSVPLETIVLTPEELNARLKIGDQFIQEILTRGEVLYAA